MEANSRLVVFSDIDGVLGDLPEHAAEAAETLKPLRRNDVPLVLCSSRTRAEIEALQQELEIAHPFVCESGGAVFIPRGYFGFAVPGARDLAGYEAVEFGRPYAEVVQKLHRTAERLAIEIVGFSDMSVEEVARACHLSLLQARLAKLREYGERFRLLDSNELARNRLVRALKANGLRVVIGEQFDHVGAPVDNTLAVNMLCGFYQHADGAVLTVGIADGMADENLLPRVNRRMNVVDHRTAKGRVDVVGWAKAIVDFVDDLHHQEPAWLATARGDRP